MALELETNIHEFTANYWKIIKIEFDICTTGKELRLSLGLYKDIDTRWANEDDYVEIVELSYRDVSFLTTLQKGNIISLLYNKLCSTGEYLDGAIGVNIS